MGFPSFLGTRVVAITPPARSVGPGAPTPEGCSWNEAVAAYTTHGTVPNVVDVDATTALVAVWVRRVGIPNLEALWSHVGWDVAADFSRSVDQTPVARRVRRPTDRAMGVANAPVVFDPRLIVETGLRMGAAVRRFLEADSPRTPTEQIAVLDRAWNAWRRQGGPESHAAGGPQDGLFLVRPMAGAAQALKQMAVFDAAARAYERTPHADRLIQMMAQDGVLRTVLDGPDGLPTIAATAAYWAARWATCLDRSADTAPTEAPDTRPMPPPDAPHMPPRPKKRAWL